MAGNAEKEPNGRSAGRSNGNAPVVLELASLPREQMGPFLILGLDKACSSEAIEQNWADRLKWARRNLVKVALEDINWAREILRDGDRRLKFDAGSLNVDTTDQVLARLANRYGLRGGQATRRWQPLDVEKALEEYTPPADVPDAATVTAAIHPPEVPAVIPAAVGLLEQLAAQPLDAWAPDLLPEPSSPASR